MFTPDAEIRQNLVAQTALLRHSPHHEGFRSLLLDRGHNATKCVQLSVDQGDDVHVCLILDNGDSVAINFREHYLTRQAIRIVEWEPFDCPDHELRIALDCIGPNCESFDLDVTKYYESTVGNDSPLPPLSWGDRMWHLFEEPPE